MGGWRHVIVGVSLGLLMGMLASPDAAADWPVRSTGNDPSTLQDDGTVTQGSSTTSENSNANPGAAPATRPYPRMTSVAFEKAQEVVGGGRAQAQGVSQSTKGLD